jgi:hypothetical protein
VLDRNFRAVLYACAAFNAGIDIGGSSLAFDEFKHSGRTNVNADAGAAAFVIIDIDSDVTVSVLVSLDDHGS